MAEQPWLLTPHHIRGLTVGQDSWAVGQVVQALTILAHHHALATTEVGEEHLLATPASRAPGKAELEGIGKENSLPRPSPSSLLMVQDFCWAEEGYSVMFPFYPDLATRLDDKFRVCNALAGKAGGEARAAWLYAMAVNGVYSDDCNYPATISTIKGRVQEQVDRACGAAGPAGAREGATQNPKKALVSLLVVEAKLQAELLFALRAVMKFMT